MTRLTLVFSLVGGISCGLDDVRDPFDGDEDGADAPMTSTTGSVDGSGDGPAPTSGGSDSGGPTDPTTDPTRGSDSSGPPARCEADAACDDDNACTLDSCDSAGACAYEAVPDGEFGEQVDGDCQAVVCQGGEVTNVIDDGDVPVDGNACTADVCTDGEPTNPPTAVSSPCGKGVCDGAGACIDCVVASDCTQFPPDDACQQRSCTAGACGQVFTQAGTVLPPAEQKPNDCARLVCDGTGGWAEQIDTTDIPEDDGNICTNQACSEQGDPEWPAAIGNPCNDNHFCTQTDTCNGFAQCTGSGNPCPGADGDSNCSESCSEQFNHCGAHDPAGSSCGGGSCNGFGTCQIGGGDDGGGTVTGVIIEPNLDFGP